MADYEWVCPICTHTHIPIVRGVCCRFVVSPHPVCLERGVTYTLRLEFRRYQDANSILDGAANTIILVDSVRLPHLFPSSHNTWLVSMWTLLPFLVHPQITLMPRHSSMEMFIAGDPASNSRKQTFERYRCHDGAKSMTRPQMSDTCAKLITSMSAIINNGALRESSNDVNDTLGYMVTWPLLWPPTFGGWKENLA